MTAMVLVFLVRVQCIAKIAAKVSKTFVTSQRSIFAKILTLKSWKMS